MTDNNSISRLIAFLASTVLTALMLVSTSTLLDPAKLLSASSPICPQATLD